MVEDMPNQSIRIGDNSNDINLFVNSEVERATMNKTLLDGKASPELKRQIDRVWQKIVESEK